MGKVIARKKTAAKKRTANITKYPEPSEVVQPSAKALRIMLKLAKENRIPQSWIDSTDDPTVAE